MTPAAYRFLICFLVIGLIPVLSGQVVAASSDAYPSADLLAKPPTKKQSPKKPSKKPAKKAPAKTVKKRNQKSNKKPKTQVVTLSNDSLPAGHQYYTGQLPPPVSMPNNPYPAPSQAPVQTNPPTAPPATSPPNTPGTATSH